MKISIDTESRLNRIKEINKLKAESAMAELIDQVKTNQAKESLGLSTNKIDLKSLQEKAAILQNEIINPSTDKNYKPSSNKV